MLTLRFKQYKSDTNMHYFIDKEIRVLVITIVYINDICFMGSKDFLLLLNLKQKFIMKWECHNFGETKEFLEIYISYNCKSRPIWVLEQIFSILQCNNQPNKYFTAIRLCV